VVLSKDKRIRYRRAEREAVRTAAVALFVFLGGNMRADEIAKTIAGALPQMNGMLATQKRPFLAGISKAGVVKLIERW
jgi:succinyl-CoA synthetase beta subunit